MTLFLSKFCSNALRAFLAFAFSALGAAWLPMQALAQSPAPEAPEIAAKAYLLLDVTANQILASRDLDMPVDPASLTKLMSA